MSIAIPLIAQDLNITNTEMGLVGSALFTTYAFGQFVNGQLGDYLGARVTVTLGILGSALSTFLFGFAGSLNTMIIVWGINGYFQSMGFSPNVKLLGDWFSFEERGPVMGLFGSCYQIGNAVSWLLAGYIASVYNWRYVFWVPSIIFGLSSIIYYWGVRNHDKHDLKTERLSILRTVMLTLGNWDVWVISFSFFFVDVVRYGFFVWVPTFLFEEQNVPIGVVAFKVFIIPLAGSFGAILSGRISKIYFRDNRSILSSILLAILGLASYSYSKIPVDNWILGLALFSLIGFCMYGAHVLIVAIMPIDFSDKGATSSATGFIDGFGYLGAVFVCWFSGWLIDNHNWNWVFNFWVISAFLASLILAPLWNRMYDIECTRKA